MLLNFLMASRLVVERHMYPKSRVIFSSALYQVNIFSSLFHMIKRKKGPTRYVGFDLVVLDIWHPLNFNEAFASCWSSLSQMEDILRLRHLVKFIIYIGSKWRFLFLFLI